MRRLWLSDSLCLPERVRLLASGEEQRREEVRSKACPGPWPRGGHSRGVGSVVSAGEAGAREQTGGGVLPPPND